MASDKDSNTPSKRQAWFCTTGLPSDVIIEVDHMTFHLHKFPLMSKSKKLNDLITQHENKHQIQIKPDSQSNEVESDEEDPEEVEPCHISLTNFPGGSETFETAAKFCYGVKIDFTAAKVAPLRCAGETLEMTDEYSDNNLISRAEKFLTQNILTNIRHSIKTLKSCEKLSPLAENLGIVDRCIQSISLKASLYDPTLFGWQVNESPSALRDMWIDDLAKLSSLYFNRVISLMRESGINQEILESCLFCYAKRCFPGIDRANRKSPISSSFSTTIASEAEQRELLENIISNISSKKRSSSPETMTVLFGLLRTANILDVSSKCKNVLERRIGAQLEKAKLDDVLIPSYSYLSETLYDVECVERILSYFVECYEEGHLEGENGRSAAIFLVGKLIDGYLSEIASDSNLKPQRFCELVVSLPEQARVYHDGVYRAVDVYLKAHPWISEEEREKIIGVMNYEKLTLEACTHAAQNERLPLRAVVQVLFFEQLQLRHAIAGTLLSANASTIDNHTEQSAYTQSDDEYDREDTRKGSKYRATIRENQVLRLDMDSMRTRVHELERECSTMKKVIQKIDSIGTPTMSEAKTGRKKGSFGRKFGCKFKTQVCDSHESTAVDVRKTRSHGNNNNQR